MAEPEGVHELYAVDPSEFVTKRDELVRSLRAAGDRDGAARVSALRKPPRTAWALNRLARDQPDRVTAVLDAAGAVQQAFEGHGDLRAAQAAHLAAVEDAVDAAVALGVGGDAMRTRMRNTVLAAGADGDVAQQWVEGVLAVDRDAPGFVLPGVTPPSRARAARERAGGPGIRRSVSGRRRRRTAGAGDGGDVGGDGGDRGDAAAERQAAERAAVERAAAERAAAELAEQRAQEQRARLRARRALDRRIERLQATAERTAAAAEEQQRRADEARDTATRAADELRRVQEERAALEE